MQGNDMSVGRWTCLMIVTDESTWEADAREIRVASQALSTYSIRVMT